MTHAQMLALAERIKKSTLPNTISPDMVGSLFTALVGSGVTDTPVLELRLNPTKLFALEKKMLFVRFANRFQDTPEMQLYTFSVVYWQRKRKKWSHRMPNEKRGKFLVKVSDCYTDKEDPNGWMLLPWTAKVLASSLLDTKSKKVRHASSRYVVINCGIVALRRAEHDEKGRFAHCIQQTLVARFQLKVSDGNPNNTKFSLVM